MENITSPTPSATPEQPQQREFTLAEIVFAWVSLLAGYLFCRVNPVGEHPLGGFLFLVAMFAAVTVILRVKGIKIGMPAFVAAGSAAVISLTLILTSNPFLHFFAYAYSVLALLYFLYSATGNRIKNGFNGYFAADFIKILFIMPFASFDKMFKAMFTGRAKNGGRTVGKIVAGLAITIIPTTVVIALLCYDEGFSDIMGRIFDFDFQDLMSHVFSFGFGIPLGMYFYGLFFSSAEGKCRGSVTEEGCDNLSRAVRILPEVTAAVSVLPLLFVYAVFFVSQWQYYISGFTGVLPEEFSYAEYAREGFFQLCAVSVINLIIITAISVFIKRSEGKRNFVLPVASLLFSLFTLILISTAMAKLYMYVDFYGLTRMRVYAAWFMALIAAVFIIVAVKQFAKKLNAVALSAAVAVVMFAALALPNVDGIIAKYNVDRYLDGSLTEVDVYALADLGDAAVPEMVRLVKELDSRETNLAEDLQLRDRLMSELRDIRLDHFYFEEDGEFFSRTIPYIRAEKALEEIDFSAE